MNSPVFLNLDYIFNKIYLFFSGASSGGGSGHIWSNILNVLNNIFYVLIFIFLTVIIYCAIRLVEVRRKEHEHMHHEIAEYAKRHNKEAEKKQVLEEVSKNPRWVAVLQYLSSENEADWKLSILEADTLLGDLLLEMGFKGEDIGERLKNANQESFKNLTLAWEAHAVRNKIAHEAGFILTIREAKRVIALYEEVFRAYGFI